MSSRQTCKPILEGGIHSTNFFNGRRITAEDLQREHTANRAHDRLLGKAIGEGIVSGLEVGFPEGVTNGGTNVAITSGLAVNRAGDALYLHNDIELSLVPHKQEPPPVGGFVPCKTYRPKDLPTGDGIYVLLMKPASGLEGSAPIIGMQPKGKVVGCGKSDVVEGVHFRLVKLDIDGPAFAGLNDDTKGELKKLLGVTDNPSVSKIRNIVAHACFGTEEKARFIADIFAPSESSVYGAIDRIRSEEESSTNITKTDVPIAILYWTDSFITYIDMWSVRRRPVQQTSDLSISTVLDRRKIAETEATFLQFQEHLRQLITQSQTAEEAAEIRVTDYFEWIPPAGVLPQATERHRGFEYKNFFHGVTVRDIPLPEIDANAYPEFLEGNRVYALLRESLAYPPFLVTIDEFLWLYRVRENRYTPDDGVGLGQAPYIIFASGHLPYYTAPRFDLARWGYSNYSPTAR